MVLNIYNNLTTEYAFEFNNTLGKQNEASDQCPVPAVIISHYTFNKLILRDFSIDL